MAKPENRLLNEIAGLRKLTVGDLRQRYLGVFGEPTMSRNKDYLFKRIAYRLQEKKYGGLTPRARAKAEELGSNAPIRRRFHTEALEEVAPSGDRDPRLPPAGTVLRRVHGGEEHQVTVLANGFEYRGKRYGGISVIAREITGTRWNGFGFFGLLAKESA